MLLLHSSHSTGPEEIPGSERSKYSHHRQQVKRCPQPGNMFPELYEIYVMLQHVYK
jgi:hypothetical protein